MACLGNASSGTGGPTPGSNPNRGYCESLGNASAASEVEFQQQQQRPLSPQHLLQQQQRGQAQGQGQQGPPRNGYNGNGTAAFRGGSFPSPSTPSNGTAENFHPFQTEKIANHSIAEANTFPSIQQVRIFYVLTMY